MVPLRGRGPSPITCSVHRRHARNVSDESNPEARSARPLDCFATLAMTRPGIGLKPLTDSPKANKIAKGLLPLHGRGFGSFLSAMLDSLMG